MINNLIWNKIKLESEGLNISASEFIRGAVLERLQQIQNQREKFKCLLEDEGTLEYTKKSLKEPCDLCPAPNKCIKFKELLKNGK